MEPAGRVTKSLIYDFLALYIHRNDPTTMQGGTRQFISVTCCLQRLETYNNMLKFDDNAILKTSESKMRIIIDRMFVLLSVAATTNVNSTIALYFSIFCSENMRTCEAGAVCK